MSPNSADTTLNDPDTTVGVATGMMRRLRGWFSRLTGGRGTATSTVFRHMLVLAAGSGAAKVIGLVTTPIITRLYAPEQYGLYMLFVALVALLAPLASLRYSAALPLPRRDGIAIAVLLTALVLLGVSVSMFAVLFAVFSDSLFRLFSAEALAPYWPLLVAAIATAGLYEILTNWSMRKRAFRTMVKAEVSQSVLSGAMKIGFALVSLQRIGLFVGHIVAQAMACLLLAPGAWREATGSGRHTSARTMKLAAIRYSGFPKYRLPSQLLLNFSQQAPLLFVSAIYGAATAGQLGLALVTMAIPLALIGQTTGQAFYAEIARIGKSQPERIHRIARDVVIRLFVLGLVPTLVLMFAGTWLFPLFFGANWHGAGVFASILSIYLLAQFVANPISHALNVFDKQHLYLRLNVVRAAMILGIFLIAYWMDLSAYMAIAAYSVVLSIHYVTTTVTIFSVIRKKVVDRGTG